MSTVPIALDQETSSSEAGLGKIPLLRLPAPTEVEVFEIVEATLPFHGKKADRLFRAVRSEVWSWYPGMSWGKMEAWMRIDFVKKVLSLLTHLSYFRRQDVMCKYRPLAADRAEARIDGCVDYWFRGSPRVKTITCGRVQL